MALNDLEQLEEGKTEVKALEDEKAEYIAEHCRSSDGDGDGVEFEENDEYCITINEQIDELNDKIDRMEDYLADKYRPLGE